MDLDASDMNKSTPMFKVDSIEHLRLYSDCNTVKKLTFGALGAFLLNSIQENLYFQVTTSKSS